VSSSSRRLTGSPQIRRRERRAVGAVAGGGQLYAERLPALAAVTVAMLGATLGLVFFYAPEEATEGFLQRIFYLHVPLAIVCLCGFVAAGVMAIQHLRTRDPRWDLRSYVAIHMSLIFGAAVLISGSIWAKGSWGHWWVWSEPTLVSFLIVFLLYATYQPLRFSIEDPERQARYASVFAITAGAFVPLNFIAVRLSTAYVHPRVLGGGSNLPGPMALTFVVSLISFALLFLTLWRFEMAAKHSRWQLRALCRMLADEDEPTRRRTAEPALGAAPDLPRSSPASAPAAGAPAPASAPTAGAPAPVLTGDAGRQAL
jgi:heme exporter protein C